MERGNDEGKNRIEVFVSDIGSVTISLFYYRNWQFFVGADYAGDANSILDRIERKYLNGPRIHKHLRRGFEKYRGELEAAIKDELGGGKK